MPWDGFWLTLVTLKGSIEAERKTSFTLSSCLMGSTKEKSSPPPPGSLKFEESKLYRQIDKL